MKVLHKIIRKSNEHELKLAVSQFMVNSRKRHKNFELVGITYLNDYQVYIEYRKGNGK
jgi:hypothetical protein